MSRRERKKKEIERRVAAISEMASKLPGAVAGRIGEAMMTAVCVCKMHEDGLIAEQSIEEHIDRIADRIRAALLDYRREVVSRSQRPRVVIDEAKLSPDKRQELLDLLRSKVTELVQCPDCGGSVEWPAGWAGDEMSGECRGCGRKVVACCKMMQVEPSAPLAKQSGHCPDCGTDDIAWHGRDGECNQCGHLVTASPVETADKPESAAITD